MQAAGSDADESVSNPNFRAVKDLTVVNDTDGKTGHIVFVARIKSRHFCGFATEQGAFGLLAAFTDTFDDIGHLLAIKFAHG